MISQKQVADAIKDLRAHYKETQVEFSRRLGCALISIARWETARPASRGILHKLVELARHQRHDLSLVFREALAQGIEPAGGGSAFTRRAIKLRSGGRIIIWTDGVDLFAITPKDREFLIGLIQMVNEYESNGGAGR